MTTPSLFASSRETRETPGPSPAGDFFPPESTAELWNAFFQNPLPRLRNTLVQHYYPLARKLAARFHRRQAASTDPGELLSAAGEGLLLAVMSFDPAFGTPFEVYATHRISGAIKDWLRGMDVQPRHLRCFERHRRQAWVQVSSRECRPARDEELAETMGLPMEYYALLAARKRERDTVSLDQGEGREASSFADEAPRWEFSRPGETLPSEGLERKWVREFLCRGLTPLERQVLVLYYYEDLTMAEIGRIVGKSESRVCQVHRQLVEQLSQRFRAREVREAV